MESYENWRVTRKLESYFEIGELDQIWRVEEDLLQRASHVTL